MKNKFMNSIYTVAVSILLSQLIYGSALGAPAISLKSVDYVEGEVLVKFKSGVTQQASAAKISAFGDVLNKQIGNDLSQVKLSAGKSVAQTIADYANDPGVEYAQPNYIYHITAVPNDTNYAQQWAFKNNGQAITNANTQPAGSALSYATNNPGTSGKDMNIEPAWSVISDCRSVVVAVVDSGVNYNHQDMAANMWSSVTYTNHGYNFSGEGSAGDPMDLNGHGTHVAGIIGAVGNNSVGIAGVCWQAKIMAVKVMDATGSGTTANIVSGLNFAVAQGAKVVNMSLGGSNLDTAFNTAITNAQSSDVVVIVAAGNDGANNDSGVTGAAKYPCNYTQANLICVAALDQAYGLASFSNYGATSVDVGAPGTNILNTWAGTKAKIIDTLSTGWTATGGGTGGAGWVYGTANSGTVNILFDQNYTANANHRAYKNFDLNGKDAAVLNFQVAGVVNSGDSIAFGMKAAGGDPFVAGVTLDSGSLNSPANFVSLAYSIRSCNSSTCTIGYSLTSAAGSVGASGPIVANFSIDTMVLNSNSYNTIMGTSMATPAVAGLATMLRAYNPSFTYTDVVNSIKNSGKAASSLSGKTTTGKSVDAMAALAYINKPTGLAATVQ